MKTHMKIRELRKRRGLTLHQLAFLSGVTKSYVSKIERSGKLPPFSTLHSIARALGVGIHEFLDTPSPIRKSQNIEIAAQAERRRRDVIPSEGGYDYEPLLTNYTNKYMAPFLIHVPTGRTRYFSHDGEEFLFVLRGTIDLHYEKKTYSLSKGDGFYLDSRIKHRFQNTEETTAVLLAVNFDYRRF